MMNIDNNTQRGVIVRCCANSLRVLYFRVYLGLLSPEESLEIWSGCQTWEASYWTSLTVSAEACPWDLHWNGTTDDDDDDQATNRNQSILYGGPKK